MKKRLVHLVLPIITLVLELLPYGAVCNFASPDGEAFRKTYSYFSLVPYGYANFAPLLTATITCVATLLLFIYLFTDKRGVISAAKILFCVDVVLSLCPLLLGADFYSVVGALITISLAVETVLIVRL